MPPAMKTTEPAPVVPVVEPVADKPVLTVDQALTSDTQEARLLVNRTAWQRQQKTLPAKPDKTFRVSYREKDAVQIKAQSKTDAWAKYCDQIQEWPSPRLPGIEIVEVP